MILNDAKCEDCGEVFTVSKRTIMENWSELHFDCEICGSANTRILTSTCEYDVAVGILGNGHTKFDREFVNKPSRYGKFKGTKIIK